MASTVDPSERVDGLEFPEIRWENYRGIDFPCPLSGAMELTVEGIRAFIDGCRGERWDSVAHACT